MSSTTFNRAQNRVVVTGISAITPLGLNLNDSWESLLKGKSGIARITKFDPEKYASKIAGEIKNFDVTPYIPKKEQKKMDIFIHYSMACAKMAIDMSGIQFTPELGLRSGAIVGVGMGGLPSIEEQFTKILERGPDRVTPFFIPMVITNMAAGQISIQYGLKGPNFSVTSACASGAHSIGEATEYIRRGLCDVMVAGGAESTVSPLGVGGFAAMRALSTRNEDPERASRPFDKDRDGFVLSEGAAILVLESMEHAKKRGANILCEIIGYGVSSDANHMTNPAPEGAGAALAIKRALEDARLNPEKIGYINAHGTSTPAGDELESMAVKKALGDHAKKVWISSTKSMTGHTLGAAGAIESAFCIKALNESVAPPTINLENPGEGCDLDYVPHTARKGHFTHVMNNSFGFGGTNATLIFAKMQ